LKIRWLLLSVCLCVPVSAAARTVPGCMACHGDDAAMKALVKPVIPVSSEGEG